MKVGEPAIVGTDRMNPVGNAITTSKYACLSVNVDQERTICDGKESIIA